MVTEFRAVRSLQVESLHSAEFESARRRRRRPVANAPGDEPAAPIELQQEPSDFTVFPCPEHRDHSSLHFRQQIRKHRHQPARQRDRHLHLLQLLLQFRLQALPVPRAHRQDTELPHDRRIADAKRDQSRCQTNSATQVKWLVHRDPAEMGAVAAIAERAARSKH